MLGSFDLIKNYVFGYLDTLDKYHASTQSSVLVLIVSNINKNTNLSLTISMIYIYNDRVRANMSH